MGFPFIQSLPVELEAELLSRKNVVEASKLYPWLTVTSNLGEGKTIGSETYNSFNNSYSKTGKYAFRPNPIISSFAIDFSARGTLRRGTISFKCYSPEQLEDVMKYFLEPGTSIFVQWGWNRSTKTGDKVGPINITGMNDTERFNAIKSFYRDTVALDTKKKNTGYCYDNMLGIITGGGGSINNETFEFSCKIVSLGEILMDGKRSDPSTKTDIDEDNLVEYGITDQLAQFLNDESTTKANWIAFFNSLPAELKTTTIQSWGETKGVPSRNNIDTYELYKDGKINYAADFIHFIKDYVEEAVDETAKRAWYDAIVNSAANAARQAAGFSPTAGKVTWFAKTFTPHGASPITEKRYIKFSAFILLLNESQKDRHQAAIKLNQQLSSAKIFKVDLSDSYCSCFPDIFSCDERIYIPNTAAYNFIRGMSIWKDSPADNKALAQKYLDSPTIDISIDTISFPRKTSVTIPSTVTNGAVVSKLEADTYGWLGDLYIDYDLAEDVLTATSTTIKDALDGLLDNISSATDGYWSFQVLADENDEYTLKIFESNLLNSKDGIRIGTFYLYGDKSFFLANGFDIDISKNMASKIVMSKTSSPKSGTPTTGDPTKYGPDPELVSIDAGITSLFNSSGLKDSVLVKLIEYKESQTDDVTPTKQPDPMSPEDLEKQAWSTFARYLRGILDPSTKEGSGYSAIGNGNMDDWAKPIVFMNRSRFTQLAANYNLERMKSQTSALATNTKSDKQIYRSTPLPVTFEFTTLGISGFKFGQMFRVIGLPSQYSEMAKGAFMIQEVKHKVENNMWTTDVTAMYRPYQL